MISGNQKRVDQKSRTRMDGYQIFIYNRKFGCFHSMTILINVTAKQYKCTISQNWAKKYPENLYIPCWPWQSCIKMTWAAVCCCWFCHHPRRQRETSNHKHVTTDFIVLHMLTSNSLWSGKNYIPFQCNFRLNIFSCSLIKGDWLLFHC